MSGNRPPQSLLETLLAQHGYLIGGEDLQRLLAFQTAEAFKKAQQRKTLPVELIKIPGRRTRFARTEDVAGWLEAQLTSTKKGGPT